MSQRVTKIAFDAECIFVFFQWSHERLKPIGLEVDILLKQWRCINWERCHPWWRARSIQPKFPAISVQNSMDRFGPTGKVSKKRVHLLRWSSFPGRTGWNFGWMDRARHLMVQISAQLGIVLVHQIGSRGQAEGAIAGKWARSCVQMAHGRNRAAWLYTVSIEEPACKGTLVFVIFETFCLWPSSKKKKKKTDSRSSPIQALRPFADRFTLTYTNGYDSSILMVH